MGADTVDRAARDVSSCLSGMSDDVEYISSAAASRDDLARRGVVLTPPRQLVYRKEGFSSYSRLVCRRVATELTKPMKAFVLCLSMTDADYGLR